MFYIGLRTKLPASDRDFHRPVTRQETALPKFPEGVRQQLNSLADIQRRFDGLGNESASLDNVFHPHDFKRFVGS